MQESPIYRFGDFALDIADRQLSIGQKRLDLSTRYFNALVLLVEEHGRLVEKDQFFEQVWHDVVVSDSALSQCIKEIRRQLGDDASNPRFIQTVPRHGYRFIAEVSIGARAQGKEAVAGGEAGVSPETVSHDGPESGTRLGRDSPVSTALAWSLAGISGGAVAGLFGGLLYGFGLAYSPMDLDLGTASVLLVLMSLTGVLGTVGGFGIGAGIAVAEYAGSGRVVGRIFGAAIGGMFVGGIVKLLGVDAFNLLFGRTPAGITGGIEGAALGFAVGLGAALGGGFEARIWWRPVAAAAGTGAVMGVLIALSGGHLMGGSLDLLAHSFSDSRLSLDPLGRYFGEVRFGETSQIVLAGIEGFIFTGCMVGALVASRASKKLRLRDPSSSSDLSSR